MAIDEDGLAFRDVAREALDLAARGPAGALEAADRVLAAAERYKKDLAEHQKDDLAPFLDDRGRPEDAYRGAIRRLQQRHDRQLRRAERDYVDRVLLAVSALLRDRVVAAVGGGSDLSMNPDAPASPGPIPELARSLATIEECRAALAEELNLNPRMLLEQAFLRCGAGEAVAGR
jgi:hypothetical protein